MTQVAADTAKGPRWVKVLDQTRCIGCHACTTACKSENEVPVGVTRTYVKSVDVGTFPAVRRAFQVTRCNQCGRAPCVSACPTGAMHRRSDGIVDFDKSICIGCRACMAACPYDAIFINPVDHSAEKCNLCAHRLEVGLEPACVSVCPTQAILVGDLNDAGSKVAGIVLHQPVAVRRPESKTEPGTYYKGADHSTLDPLVARRPGGGLFAWATQGAPGAQAVPAGHPGRHGSSAAALLSYDVPHFAPWGWKVSLFTFTKGLACGGLLVPLLLTLLGRLGWSDPVMALGAPAVGLGALGLTGGLLVADLEHPLRFWMIFTHHKWGSWVVRGAFVIAAYGAALSAALVAGAVGATGVEQVAAALGGPLAIATACYTARLFAQARGRELWRSRLLAPHLLVQGLLAGAAATLPIAEAFSGARAVHGAEVVLALAAAMHLAAAAGELTTGHSSAHARLAVEEILRGRFARWFWPSVVAVAVAVTAPLIGVSAAPFALVGLFAYEHAYIQGAQCVPLA
jgi:Fe-S-cluster-containing dehydrogenase component